jgi:hypothetical protein
MHPAAGQLDPNSLAACAGVMLRSVATERGLVIHDGSVLAEGDLDFRGTLGIGRDAPVGFGDIRLSFSLDTEETTSRPTGTARRQNPGTSGFRARNELILTRSGRHAHAVRHSRTVERLDGPHARITDQNAPASDALAA